jgi:hypothetical protein
VNAKTHFEAAIDVRGRSNQVTLIEPERAESIVRQVLLRFVSPGTGPWWERFESPESSVQFDDDLGYQWLPHFAPRQDACYLIVDVENASAVAVFAGLTPELAAELLADCPLFEYYLVAENLSWLLCENDHGFLIGCGEAAEHVRKASAA